MIAGRFWTATANGLGVVSELGHGGSGFVCGLLRLQVGLVGLVGLLEHGLGLVGSEVDRGHLRTQWGEGFRDHQLRCVHGVELLAQWGERDLDRARQGRARRGIGATTSAARRMLSDRGRMARWSSANTSGESR
jgi:hypothetical protein